MDALRSQALQASGSRGPLNSSGGGAGEGHADEGCARVRAIWRDTDQSHDRQCGAEGIGFLLTGAVESRRRWRNGDGAEGIDTPERKAEMGGGNRAVRARNQVIIVAQCTPTSHIPACKRAGRRRSTVFETASAVACLCAPLIALQHSIGSAWKHGLAPVLTGAFASPLGTVH